MDSGLLRDEDWRPLDGELCRVIAFTPLADSVEDTEATRRLPYASIQIESRVLAEPTTGFITHSLDFQHLWQAFNVRGDDEEVIVIWNKSSLGRVAHVLSRAMPGLMVWVCPKDAYELMNDPGFRPELKGLERHHASNPRARWEPEVLR